MRSQAELHTLLTHTYIYSTFAFISVSHHLFRLSLPPHDICTRVSELVIGYTMSEYTHTQTPVVHMDIQYIYTYELMYALPVAFLYTGLANDVGGVENHIALAITVPCLPPSLLLTHVWCCFIR